MRTTTLVKLPFRIGRAVVRAVREELRLAREGGPRPAPPASPSTPAPVPAATPSPPTAPATPSAPSAPRPPVQVFVEETPNPDALKFRCSVTVVKEGSVALNDAQNAAGLPFAEAIFRLDGIRTVFATKDFVTVTRRPEGPGWETLRPAILQALGATVGA